MNSNDVDREPALTSAELAICTPAEPGEHTAPGQQHGVSVGPIEEVVTEDIYGSEGELTNYSGDIARDTTIRGIGRDSEGRFAGNTISSFTDHIAAGGMIPFSVWAVGFLDHKAHRTVLLAVTVCPLETSAGTAP